jgi:tetratricopeptide (TPR) repeat protein
LGERWTRSLCIECLGLLLIEADDIAQAEIYLEEALSLAREIEAEFVVARRLALLSILLYLQGNMEKSKQNFRESISLIKDLHPYLRVFFLETLFISPYFQVPENSVLLLGALSSCLAKFDIPMDSLYTLEFLFRPYYVRAEARARESLGEVAFETAFAEGQKLSLDEALDLALKTVEEM